MKTIDVTIDGINYHAINVLNKPDNRFIVRTRATSGQVFQLDFNIIHHISYKKDGETVTLNGLLKSTSNNVKIADAEFLIVDE